MKLVTAVQSLSLVGLVTLGIASYTAAPVVKADNDEITICHGAGLDGTTHFETLTISRNAVYQDHGEGGHFYENGTTKAGHEQDYLGACITASADPSVEPSVSPSVSPSPSQSADPTATPTPTPKDNNNGGGSGDGLSDGRSSCPECTQAPKSDGQVLGAYAETGVVQDVIMNALGSLGGLMTAAGSVLYGNKKTKRNR